MAIDLVTLFCLFHFVRWLTNRVRRQTEHARITYFAALLPAGTPILLLLALGNLVAQADEPLQYNRDIRPVLAEACFACHGRDAAAREADLRLDVAESAYQGGQSQTPAIVRGDPESSLLWGRITSTDEDEKMPPPDAHRQLDDAERALIRKWIEQGANYQKHWAFEAPSKPDGDCIDDFIRHALTAQSSTNASGSQPLEMSREADPRTLIRRLSFAITGLPPTLDELNTYLADYANDPEGAYERIVDRYLGSPHYGEEMARHWLDVARYGDTHGMHLDNERQMWAYRDWVVGAFNDNLPYDEFTVDQLAGDLLPNPSQDQWIATGFNRCNVTTGEGGSINREFIFRYAVDRASTTAQAWLGLTAGCAVCHDHKYDPISTKEFYALYAFFHSNADPAMDGNALLTKPVVKVKSTGYDAQIDAFDQQLAAVREEMQSQVAHVQYNDPAEQATDSEPQSVDHVWYDDEFPEGAKLGSSGTPIELVDQPVISGQKAIRISGDAMAQIYYDSGASRLSVPSQPEFFLSVYLDPENPPNEIMIQFHNDGWKHRALWGDDIIPFGTKNTTERFRAGDLPETGKWIRLHFDGSDVGLAAGGGVTGFAFTVHGGTAYFDKMGVTGTSNPATDPRLSFTAWRAAQAGKDTALATGSLKDWIKQGPQADRSPEERQQIRDFYLQYVCETTRNEFSQPRDDLAAIQKQKKDFENQSPSTFVYKDLDKPRESFVMLRGQYDTPGDRVEPGTPAILPELHAEQDRANRLDLARWIVDGRNPLTARVAVNRFWQQLFGIGLVESSHDFGTQGTLPSHPLLLDWLAVTFQESGWDVKALIRQMVTSKTFRQQSRADKKAWARDPKNRLLARGPRFRLAAEQIRDQVLAVSGLIEWEIGGKGVNPYQPPNIWEPVAFGGSNTRFYKQSAGRNLYRRTLYTFLKRTAPHPMLSNFDVPAREQSCIHRDRTNTPLQALQLMNDVQHYEAARKFAARILRTEETTEQRIDFAMQTVLARHPHENEVIVISELLNRQVKKYQDHPEQAKQVADVGESPTPDDLDPSELAAWSLVANLILNMDEAIMRN